MVLQVLSLGWNMEAKNNMCVYAHVRACMCSCLDYPCRCTCMCVLACVGGVIAPRPYPVLLHSAHLLWWRSETYWSVEGCWTLGDPWEPSFPARIRKSMFQGPKVSCRRRILGASPARICPFISSVTSQPSFLEDTFLAFPSASCLKVPQPSWPFFSFNMIFHPTLSSELSVNSEHVWNTGSPWVSDSVKEWMNELNWHCK